MKKLLSVLLAGGMVLTSITSFADVGGISVTVDGKKLALDQEPVVVSDRVLVPFRAIFEALGCEVFYYTDYPDGGGTYVGGRNGAEYVGLTIGEKEMNVNGERKAIDVAPIIKNNRTLVPVRAISEGIGAAVNWDADSKKVSIESKQGQYKITSEKIEFSTEDKDGKELVNATALYPVIENSGNSPFISKINDIFKKNAENYIENVKNMWVDDAKEVDSDVHYLPYEFSLSYNIGTNRNDILSITNYDYHFTGGAHPNSVKYSYNYDMKAEKELTLTDVVKGEKKKIVKDAFESSADDYEMWEELSENIDKFADTAKFYITDNSVVVYFDVYEVAPYAAGYPSAEIPYSKDTFKYDLSDADLDVLKFSADGDPTTGYTWEVVSGETDKVEITKDFKADQGSLDGVFTFEVRGRNAGNCTVEFANRRILNGKENITESVKYKLRVSSDGKITVLSKETTNKK